jgi:hypothetical protein
MPALSDTLAGVVTAEKACFAANVEENDYTVFTCQDLQFELELVEQSIAKKIAFIDNQVILSSYSKECRVADDFVCISFGHIDCLAEYDKFNSGPTGTIREYLPVL